MGFGIVLPEKSALKWLFLVFLVWTAVGFIVIPLNLHHLPIAYWGDAIWMCLGAGTVFCYFAHYYGLRKAAIAIGGIVITSALLEWLGVTSGWPFGPYQYTSRLGYKLFGLLPITIPAAWTIIVVNSHFALPDSSWRPWGVGVCAVSSDLTLEYMAWKIRAYWVWYPKANAHSSWPPLQNFVSWFLIAALLDWCFLRHAINAPTRLVPRTTLILANLLFIVATISHLSFVDR